MINPKPSDVPAIDDYRKLLDGRVAVITGGGSRGIGGGIARWTLSPGWRHWCHARG